MPTIYRKHMTRDLALFGCEYWWEGERREISKMFSGSGYGMNPFFVSTPGFGVGVHYDWYSEEDDPIRLAEHFNAHESEVFGWIASHEARCAKVTELIRWASPEDFALLHDEVIAMWPMIVASNLPGDFAKVAKPEIRDSLFALRLKTDHVAYDAGDAMIEMAKALVGSEYADDVKFLRRAEILTGKFPAREELDKRKRGYIFSDGELLFMSLDEFLVARDFAVEVPDADPRAVSGICACPGIIQGEVRVLYTVADIPRMHSGDILVMPMTTPNFLSAIKLAGAIVTDEGGITCHAAIVARELGKPCIIGTKNATEALHDGDLVEVDAERGIVTKL
ncbi:MAG: PEP-utilizing enzyme [Patescibacteria group bacterium]|jgi:phosphohistidine swiveling domain-containing protein